MAHINEPIPRLPSHLGNLQPLLDRLLAKEPGQRFADAGELIAAVDTLLSGGKLSPVSRPEAKTQALKASGASGGKSNGLAWAVGGGLLALLLAGGLFLFGGRHPRPVFAGGGGEAVASSPAGPANTSPGSEGESPLAKGQAILVVSSEPTGAEVLLDGRKLGVTPLTREDLPAGRHTLKLRRHYYDAVTAQIELAKGVVVKKHLSLDRGRGRITILTNPSDATVTLDGHRRHGKTPLTLTDVRAGKHTLDIHHDRYYDAERKLDLGTDETAKVQLSLKGGNLVAYQGKWMEPGKAAKLKAAAEKKAEAERERQAKLEAQRRAEAARKAELAKQAKFTQLLAAGRAAIKAYDKKTAVAKLQAALQLYPDNVEAKAALAKVRKILPSTFTDPTTGMQFVLVPGGCFQMGNSFGGGNSDEKPVHEVCIDSFYMGKYEVTQSQYQAITGSNPSYFKNGPNYPVEDVSWNDAQDYIRQLNSHSGRDYRLPTEAEWEYACRSGGKNEKYCGGDDVDAVAWHSGNSGNQTHPVGQKAPNGLGIYDMSGNVWEWCQDWYDNGYYGQSPRNNPQGPSGGSDRVNRGGSWSYGPRFARAADRSGRDPGYRGFILGFRLVLPAR